MDDRELPVRSGLVDIAECIPKLLGSQSWVLRVASSFLMMAALLCRDPRFTTSN